MLFKFRNSLAGRAGERAGETIRMMASSFLHAGVAENSRPKNIAGSGFFHLGMGQN